MYYITLKKEVFTCKMERTDNLVDRQTDRQVGRQALLALSLYIFDQKL
ncbi:MAG: hypothetical protein IJ683_06720 [Butyrivibrio sp.]|nr:hypothetical protein [Butyrivibrio sp.]MBR1641995.1 hypothetical protein [Butyrivibrio sp.]